MEKSLKDKVAIVTGATRGIGRAIALELASAGAKIAFNYAKSEDKANQLLMEIEKAGSRGFCMQCDSRDFDASKKFVNSSLEHFGSLDFLVNNAGITKDRAFVMMTKEEWTDVIETNLTGYFNMARCVIFTLLKQKSGGIVNISSISGLSGITSQVNYSASKAGIIGLTKALAKETAPYNIRVNCVAPGYIETDMTAKLKDEVKEASVKSIPLGRFGKCDEVSKVVLFLLSERSKYITGQVIKVDGGLHTA